MSARRSFLTYVRIPQELDNNRAYFEEDVTSRLRIGAGVHSGNKEQIITQLYETHYEHILAYCIRRIGHDRADDVAMEVFAVAWRRIEEIDLTTALPWLYGVARRTISNRWRSDRRADNLSARVRGMAQPRVESPDVIIAQREADQEVRNALGRLRPSDREILMLAAWEELSGPEMARVLGITISAAEQRLHRAKRRLARHLGSVERSTTVFPRAARQEGEG